MATVELRDIVNGADRTGDGAPQPFYERYGFVPMGDVMEAEVVLRLDLLG